MRKLQAGDRTALKRSLGVALRDADAKAWAAFYKVSLAKDGWDESASFIAACAAAAFHNCPGPGRALPVRLSELKDESESAQRRLMQLLDVPLSQNAYFAMKIGRILRMLLAKGINVDVADLMTDLQGWDFASRSVQLSWARVFFGAPGAREQTQQNEEERKHAD